MSEAGKRLIGAAKEALAIVRNPDIQGGAPCIAGTRVPVSAVQSFHRAGYFAHAIQREYPTLTIEQIKAAVEWREPAMTDTIERVARALEYEDTPRTPEDDAYVNDASIPIEDRIAYNWRHEAKAALSALTPGSRWTAPDGTEMVAVPVEPTVAMMAAANRLNHPRDEEIWTAMLSAAEGEK